ncbi:MAG: DUF1289 domain-containing protein [Fluviibacter sp.]|jgi:predicted Fe-S protein YdhL (DUF1289 family)
MACRIKPEVETPCVNICRMDAHNHYCIGCWRTLDEIQRWAAMSDDERTQIMTQLESRVNV